MTTKRSISLILVIVMTLCLLAGCKPDPGINNPPSENVGPQYGGVLNLAWTGNGSDSLDPLYNTGWLTYIWATNVFETAISRDAEGNFVPCVCDFELSAHFVSYLLADVDVDTNNFSVSYILKGSKFSVSTKYEVFSFFFFASATNENKCNRCEC